MPRTPKKSAEPLAPVADAILDHFGPATGMSMAEIDAATRRLKRALVERMLGGELSHHLGYAPGAAKPPDETNHRNGTSGKTVLTDDGPGASGCRWS
jgi:transposase-like protein